MAVTVAQSEKMLFENLRHQLTCHNNRLTAYLNHISLSALLLVIRTLELIHGGLNWQLQVGGYS